MTISIIAAIGIIFSIIVIFGKKGIMNARKDRKKKRQQMRKAKEEHEKEEHENN